MDWNFNWITDWDTICGEDFQRQWREWYDRGADSHVFFHHVAGRIWIDAYRPLREMEPLFCVASKGEAEIFMPLVLWKRDWKSGFQKILIPLGHSDYDYHDPLISRDGEGLIEGFMDRLAREAQRIKKFDRIEIHGLRHKGEEEEWSQKPEYSSYCELHSYENGSEFLGSLKTSLRGDLRRQLRRMEDKGAITLYAYTADKVKEALEILPEFLNCHSKRWPGAYKAPGFHQRLIEDGLLSGIVDFTELRISDKAVSWHLGFRDKGRYYYYMPAIREQYSVFSPGKVHLLYLVQRSIDEGMKVFDHLRGEENYKSDWTRDAQLLFGFSKKSGKLTSRIKNWAAEKKEKVVEIRNKLK